MGKYTPNNRRKIWRLWKEPNKPVFFKTLHDRFVPKLTDLQEEATFQGLEYLGSVDFNSNDQEVYHSSGYIYERLYENTMGIRPNITSSRRVSILRSNLSKYASTYASKSCKD